MLGFDPRAARAAWTVFLVALLLAVVYFIRNILLVFTIAVLFAYLLSPVVELVHRFLGWPRSRTYSLALVYTALIALLVLAGSLVGSGVTREADNLSKRYPELVRNVEETLKQPGPAWLQPVKNYILAQIEERKQSMGSVVLPVVMKASRHVSSVLSSALFIVLTPILSFFLLKDGKELREQILSATVTGRRREMLGDVVADVSALLGQFIRALVILSIATFISYSIFFSVIGLPYPLLLASAAGLLEVIPVFGPLAAAIIIVVAAALTGGGHLLLILGFLGAYRIFQDYILNPHLMSAGVALHPLLVIFGALAGEELAGVAGMFLSVPVLAILRVVYVRIRKALATPEPTVTAS